ncbi:MAG TPA: kelch repeat-containing protein [Actinomycetota bacterium]|nr:kelch repeat-containing protein [Actinomycetota bacterium]
MKAQLGLAGVTQAPSPGPPTGWRQAACMQVARSAATATLLADGSVLVAGGDRCDGVLASAERYDPDHNTWTLTGSMTTRRNLHVAALLHDGRVLVAGGFNGGGSLASAELYDQTTGAWTPIGSMSVPRSLPLATPLQDGRQVLVAGGMNGTTELASAELFDLVTGTWAATGSMSTSRLGATMTLLQDGRVLVAGGFVGATTPKVLATCELYDPTAGTWSATAPMGTSRCVHAAVLGGDGTVLVAGGFDGAATLASAELYAPGPAPGPTSWTPTAGMSTARQLPTATLLGDGSILVVGGGGDAGFVGSAEVYDPPPKGVWNPPAPTIGFRATNTITRLATGEVLVAGGNIGNTNAIDALASTELFST